MDPSRSLIYRRRATALHAAGPLAGLSYCAALGAAALIGSAAGVRLAVLAAVLLGGVLAQVGAALRRGLAGAVLLGLAVALINALVSEQGTTVLWTFGTLPLVGFRYVTLQAVEAGALLGLRAVTLILVGVLVSTCVDPDAVLGLARRISFRSALTATVATRLVPVLSRDAQRRGEALRTRPGPPPGRVALLEASTHGMLDRALDIAATLEVRGYGLTSARRAARRRANRHDRAFGAAALVTLAGAILADTLTPWAGAGILLAAGLPFLDRRGIA